MYTRSKLQHIKFPCPAFRVRIAVRKGKWSIEKIASIASKTLRQSEQLPDRKSGWGISGFWIEVLNKKDEPLYRRFLSNPFERTVEIFDSSGSAHREEIKKEDFMFEVLIPQVTDASYITIFSDINEKGRKLRKAEILQKLPLLKKGNKDEKGKKGDSDGC